MFQQISSTWKESITEYAIMEVPALYYIVSWEHWDISKNDCLPRYYNSCGQGIGFELFENRTFVLVLKGIVFSFLKRKIYSIIERLHKKNLI